MTIALQFYLDGKPAGLIPVEPGTTVGFQLVEVPPPPPDPTTQPCACGSGKLHPDCHGKDEPEAAS